MSALQDVVDLYGKGGLEVTTYPDTDQRGAARSPHFRTVIQPDGDIIILVSWGADYGATWQRHHEKLRNKIRSMRRARRLVRYGGFLLSFALFAVYNVATRELLPLVISLVASTVAAFLIRFAVAFALRLYIRDQLNELLSPLKQG